MVHADHPAALIKRFLRQLNFLGGLNPWLLETVWNHTAHIAVLCLFFNLKTDQTIDVVHASGLMVHPPFYRTTTKSWLFCLH